MLQYGRVIFKSVLLSFGIFILTLLGAPYILKLSLLPSSLLYLGIVCLSIKTKRQLFGVPAKATKTGSKIQSNALAFCAGALSGAALHLLHISTEIVPILQSAIVSGAIMVCLVHGCSRLRSDLTQSYQ